MAEKVYGQAVMAAKTITWRAGETKPVCRSKIINKDWTAGTACSLIAGKKFQNNNRIRTVKLPAQVKDIGPQSFANSSLRSIWIEGVSGIRSEAFRGCAHIQEICLPATLHTLEKRAFAQCRRMQRAVFEEGSVCSELPSELFAECQSLEEVILPDGVEKIGRRAFYKCVSLEELHFPVALREIGMEAFYQTSLRELELPDGLEVIGDSAFLKCNQLRYVRLPESVRVIKKWAFHGCNRLEVLEITHDPEEIGPWIINKSAKIRCRKGSAVDRYCRENGFEAEYITK